MVPATGVVSAGRGAVHRPKPGKVSTKVSTKVATRAARDGSSSSSAVNTPPIPRRDYSALFQRSTDNKCPPLFLAPMEGLGDQRLRKALSNSTGGFDEACREFTRVPGQLSQGANPEKLLTKIALNGYDANELRILGGDDATTSHENKHSNHLLAAQLMGSNSELLTHCAKLLATQGNAPRVDLNCGCPANVVTGKGAGSSLLRDPYVVQECIAAVARGVENTGCAVSLKMRSGYGDRGLLRDNLLAAQAGGAEFITLHPRTRSEGYTGHARWEDIAFAVDLLDIPVIGNGDVTSPEKALRMLTETNCHGIMIGRGAVQDPLLFRRIKNALESDFGNDFLSREDETLEIKAFLNAFAVEAFSDEAFHNSKKSKKRVKTKADLEGYKLGKLKQICKYLFAGNEGLRGYIHEVLNAQGCVTTADELLQKVNGLIDLHWHAPEDVLVDAFSMRAEYDKGMR